MPTPILKCTTSSMTTSGKKRKRAVIDETHNIEYPLWRDGREMHALWSVPEEAQAGVPRAKKQKVGGTEAADANTTPASAAVRKEVAAPSVEQQAAIETPESASSPASSPASAGVSAAVSALVDAVDAPASAANQEEALAPSTEEQDAITAVQSPSSSSPADAGVSVTSASVSAPVAESAPAPKELSPAEVKAAWVEEDLVHQDDIRKLNETKDVGVWNALTKEMGERAAARTAQQGVKRSRDDQANNDELPTSKKQKQREDSPEYIPWGTSPPKTDEAPLVVEAQVEVAASSTCASTPTCDATNGKKDEGEPKTQGEEKRSQREENPSQESTDKTKKVKKLNWDSIGGPHRKCEGLKDACIFCEGDLGGTNNGNRKRPFSYEYPHPETFKHIKGYPREKEVDDDLKYEDLSKLAEVKCRDETEGYWKKRWQQDGNKIRRLIATANSPNKAASDLAYANLMGERDQIFWLEFAYIKFTTRELEISSKSKAYKAAGANLTNKVRLRYKPEFQGKEIWQEIDKKVVNELYRQACLKNFHAKSPMSKMGFWTWWQRRDVRYLNSVVDRSDLIEAKLSPKPADEETGFLSTGSWIEDSAEEAFIPSVLKDLPNAPYDYKSPAGKKMPFFPAESFILADPEQIEVEVPKDVKKSGHGVVAGIGDADWVDLETPAYGALAECEGRGGKLSPKAQMLKKLWEQRSGDSL